MVVQQRCLVQQEAAELPPQLRSTLNESIAQQYGCQKQLVLQCARSLREAMAATVVAVVVASEAVVVASEAVVATTKEAGEEEGVLLLMLRVVAHVAEEEVFCLLHQEKSLRPFYPINEVGLVQFFRKSVQMFCR